MSVFQVKPGDEIKAAAAIPADSRKMTDTIVTDLNVLQTRSEETCFQEVKDLKLDLRIQTSLRQSWTKGLGLAAIQIGVPLRFAWYQMHDAAPVYLINPEIVKVERLASFRGEGCLSMPDRWFQTWRFDRVSYLNDVAGERKLLEATGLEAFLIQHEVDHMDGILCDARVKKPQDPGRNEPCPCGSGKKFKKCCLGKSECDPDHVQEVHNHDQ